jgi:hypothetical protein
MILAGVSKGQAMVQIKRLFLNYDSTFRFFVNNSANKLIYLQQDYSGIIYAACLWLRYF